MDEVIVICNMDSGDKYQPITGTFDIYLVPPHTVTQLYIPLDSGGPPCCPQANRRSQRTGQGGTCSRLISIARA